MICMSVVYNETCTNLIIILFYFCLVTQGNMDNFYEYNDTQSTIFNCDTFFSVRYVPFFSVL